MKTLEKLQFRTITPLFNFSLEDENSKFTYKNKLNDCEFELTIEKYGKGPVEYNRILAIPDDYTKKRLVSLHNDKDYGHTDYFLCCNLFYFNDVHINAENTEETNELSNSVIQAIRAVSSRGLDSRYTYILRKPFHPLHYTNVKEEDATKSFGNCITISPLCFPHIFGPLIGELSILKKETYEVLTKEIEYFLRKKEDSRFNRLLSLSYSNYYYSFVVENAAHSFLLLIISCDALFKKPINEDGSNASSRIARLLAKDKYEMKSIRKQFWSNDDSFYKIRNRIAHGDPDIDLHFIKEKAKELFHYMQSALILLSTDIYELLDNNYYEALDNLLKKKIF